jgi:methyltransferase (TIGR00027 family)
VSERGQWDIGSGVGLTALAAAAGRAVESSRPDRLLDDPFAAAFVAAAHAPVPLPTRWPDAGTEQADRLTDQELLLLYGAGYVGLRSRLCDDYLRGAAAAGVHQIVVLAAGLDTRAFRLDWPAGVRLFEVDQPKVLEFKDAVLRERGATARCGRTAVAADLREDWAAALTGTGFAASAPTAWLAEGLLQYLPAEAERALFTRSAWSPPPNGRPPGIAAIPRPTYDGCIAYERCGDLACRSARSRRCSTGRPTT